MSQPFDTPIETVDGALAGPWRGPRQMLEDQSYDGHTSIHDDKMAEKLGFRAGPIEGPTHFSQFGPLGVALWGERFLSEGKLSAHFRNMVVEGEEVRAFMQKTGDNDARIWATKRDGTEVLKGTASVGANAAPSALDVRLKELAPLDQPVILRDLKVGMRTPRVKVRMDAAQHMGDLYPFSLNEKLGRITESSDWYSDGAATPWKKAVIPFEMISVLVEYRAREDRLPIKGPAVGLFADQEISLIKGPLFVGEDYEIEREIVMLSGSKRTESYWTKSFVYKPGSSEVIAAMLLNHAVLRDSYAPYAKEKAELHG